MSNFNFYKAEKAYGEIFLQFPKVFLTSPEYKFLSDSAKIAYMIFKDRFAYSLKNNWIDKEGNLYFIYTNTELMSILGKSKNKVTAIKQELEKAGLLLQKTQGYDHKRKKNYPNHLYLADLEVSATDIYQLQKEVGNSINKIFTKKEAETLTSGEIPKNGISKNELKCKETLASSGIPKNGISKNGAETLASSGIPKNGTNLYITKSSKDSKDGKESEKADQTDTNLISNAFQPKEENQETERQIMMDYIKEQELEFLYGTQLIQKMVTFSFNDFDTFKTFINKLEFSHKSVEKEYNLSIPIHQGTEYFEDTQERLLSTFNRAIQHHRFGKVNNIANYLFISFKQVFIDLADGMIAKRQTEKSRSPLFEIDINSFESNEN